MGNDISPGVQNMGRPPRSEPPPHPATTKMPVATNKFCLSSQFLAAIEEFRGLLVTGTYASGKKGLAMHDAWISNSACL